MDTQPCIPKRTQHTLNTQTHDIHTEKREELEGLAVRSSESMKLFPAALALDSNARSCFYSHRSPPKWIQVDFGRGSEKKLASLIISLPAPTTADESEYIRRRVDMHSHRHVGQDRRWTSSFLSLVYTFFSSLLLSLDPASPSLLLCSLFSHLSVREGLDRLLCLCFVFAFI